MAAPRVVTVLSGKSAEMENVSKIIVMTKPIVTMASYVTLRQICVTQIVVVLIVNVAAQEPSRIRTVVVPAQIFV
jgi:hypothetical protein